MSANTETKLRDTGERMIPPSDEEISFVFARHRFAYQYVLLQRVFDVAVSFQVIEHMADIHGFVEQLKKIAKPGGTIFISTPNVPRAQRAPDNERNRFHQNEMDYDEFRDLMMNKFPPCHISGVIYESDNRIRDLIQKLPCYRWGAFLKRNSKIKKLANRALDLTKFRLTDTDLAKSMDLLAICKND